MKVKSKKFNRKRFVGSLLRHIGDLEHVNAYLEETNALYTQTLFEVTAENRKLEAEIKELKHD